MSSLSVVPAPAALVADPAAPPFTVGPGIRISGATDAPGVLAALIAARTGIEPELGDRTDADGTIAFTLTRGGAPESYRIVVDGAGPTRPEAPGDAPAAPGGGVGTVSVTAPDAAGLFYAAQTLGQLLAARDGAWIIPAVEIDDVPRFGYRGAMLDVARHFFDVDTVKAYLDRIATLKLNALHLHLSDDQGWRLQLASRPRLTELASGSAVGGDRGGFYTKADYADIVAHAASRHIIVVPEFDMPGHTHAVGLAYPEIVEAPVVSEHAQAVIDAHGGGTPVIGRAYTGMAVGFSSLKTRDEATYDFVCDVFGELAAMTPGPYLHFGGDESLATSADDFATFVTRVSQIIADLGKTPVAWHEAGAAAAIDDDTVGQYWGFLTPTDGMDDKARTFVANGSRVILSPADAVYLDMKYDDATRLGLTWANGPTSVRDAYDWEPTGIVEGIDEDDILGIEAPLWSETLRVPEDLDTMAFPRIAAAAEAAWSPAAGTTPLRTWESFRTRVGAIGPLWSSLGIRFSVSPEIDWVAQIDRPAQ